MKHPLADLVLPEDSQEGHYHKKKSYRAKDEEIKSPDQKSYSKDHPEASPPQKDPQRPHSLREDHAKTDPSNTIQVSGNSSAPHHHILPSDLSTSNSVLPNSAGNFEVLFQLLTSFNWIKVALNVFELEMVQNNFN